MSASSSTPRARLSRAAILAASAAGIVFAGADCGGRTQDKGATTSSATSTSTTAAASSGTQITSAPFYGAMPPPLDSGSSLPPDAAANDSAADMDGTLEEAAAPDAGDAAGAPVTIFLPPYGQPPVPPGH